MITLLRHGAIPKAYQKCYVGWEDIPLDESLFEKQKFQKRDFDFIFSSDLTRCTQTLEMLGFFSYQTDSRLREVAFKKEIAMKSFAEVEQLPSFKKAYLKDSSSWHHYICEECEADFHQRIKDFLGSLPKDKDILICTHAGVIRHILSLYYHPPREISYLESITLKQRS